MKRTRKIKANPDPDLILCSDLHLRLAPPRCRIDDFRQAMLSKLKALKALQERYNIPIFCAGDVFDKWDASPELLTLLIEQMPYIHTIAGQHDLPYHNMHLLYKSGLSTLVAAGKAEVMSGEGLYNWDAPFPKKGIAANYGHFNFDTIERDIIIAHTLVWDEVEPFPGARGSTAIQALKTFPKADLILTGDNHQPFVTEYKGRVLVNPGSMLRLKADQKDHQPRAYLYYAEDNRVEPYYFKIDPEAVSTHHTDAARDRKARAHEFALKTKKAYNTTISFRDNVEQEMNRRKTAKSIRSIVMKSLERSV